MYFSNITKPSESIMNQNSKKKTKITTVVMSMIIVLVLSPVGFDQASAIQDENDKSLSVESNSSSSSSMDKTIRLTGGEPCFVPSSIQIGIGDKVTFVNVDGADGGMAHAIISVNGETGIPDGTFDSGLLKTSDKFEVQFDESGIYTFVDSMHHPEMHGIIVVE